MVNHCLEKESVRFHSARDVAFNLQAPHRWHITQDTPRRFVESFPNAGNRLRISTNGGAQPRWSRDGRELFYIAADRKLMVVNLKAGDTIEASVPKPLFDTRALTVTDFRNHYVVTNDGQRFLINSLIEEVGSAPISVVVNWTAGLK